MTESLSLAFPELRLASPKTNAVVPLIDKFERMAKDADGPIRAIRRTPAREADYAGFPEDLNPALREVLTRRSIAKLYSHQADAWESGKRRREPCRGHADRQRQDPLLQPAHPESSSH